MNDVTRDMENTSRFRGESVEDAAESPNLVEGFRIGTVDIHPALLRVTRDGRSIRLEPKVMDVLVTLAKRSGTVVSRQAIQTEVWGTLNISEDLPRRAISALRKALGDDVHAPRYIETIPRSGYRLLPAVVEAADDAMRPEAPVASTMKAPRTHQIPIATRKGRFNAVALLMAATAFLAMALLFIGLRGRATPLDAARAEPRTTVPLTTVPLTTVPLTTVPLTTVPLTTAPGLEYDPAISPDGSRVVFLRAADLEVGTAVSLELQMVGESQSLRLTELAADLDHPIESPTWSPDGTRIAFRRWQQGTGWDLYSVSALGGDARRLHQLGRNPTAGLDWSPDGRTLVFSRSPRESAPLAVQALDLEDHQLTTLTTPPPTSIGDRWPVFSPDGSQLAFARFFGDDAAEILIVDADGFHPRPLLTGRHKIADLAWSVDGRQLLISTFDSGRHQVRRLRTDTVESILPVAHPTDAAENARWLSVPRTGDRWVYARSAFSLSVREIDLTSGASVSLPTLSSTFFDEALAVDPTGNRLAMISTRSGSFELWMHHFDGLRTQRLSSFGHARLGKPTWVRGATRIVFDANPDGAFDLFTVGMTGGPPQGLTDHPDDERMPSASADGESIVFGSNRSGDWEVWTMPALGGDAERLTRNGGYIGQLSNDGRWLYFTKFQEAGLWRQPVRRSSAGPRARADSGAEKIVDKEPKPWEQGNWMLSEPDQGVESGIWIVTRDDAGAIFLSLFERDGKPVRRVPFVGTPVQPSLTRAPREGFALLVNVDRIESDLVLVEGGGSAP